MTSPRFFIASGVILAAALAPRGFSENLHFTYLWHLEQPIYWPARQAGGADRYERAWESIQQKDAGRANPADNLRSIFSLADRVAAYQYRPRDCVNQLLGRPEAGAQVSFSGGLYENIQSLGTANQLGYSPNWHQWFREARNWVTGGGKPRVDIVLFPFHHPLLPLCDDATVRMQIRLYKEAYADAWGSTPGLSRGLFPSEMAFSERLIPALAAEGVSWVIVSNEHISRACENYPLVLGSGGVNCEPPNRADQVNSPGANWFRLTISRGCSPVNAAPLAYTPHYARYIDPQTGVEHRVIAVPADQSLGWMDGFSPLPRTHFDTLNASNNASRPMLVLLAHDGDNAWGGGFSYYMEATPNFVNSVTPPAGYVATTVEQYLQDHPVPTTDLVHVEDGAWVNADGDFGSPTFLNWNWPLINTAGEVDVANGWHVDPRNWAVITAAQNRVLTAEQIECGGDCVRPRKVLYPDAATTAAERAWHYFCGALNSGFMYYGVPLDHEVKATLACNLACDYADPVIGGGTSDTTPPTVWIPQRWPYNPGALNFGPAHYYQAVQDDGDFWVWTFAYDVSGISTVVLKTRVDADGRVGDANQTYAGGAGVGAWQTTAMTRRAFPAGNVLNDPQINFFLMPRYIAEQFHVQVTGVRDQLLDYYVEATDSRGFVKRSPIQHVYVGPGGGGPAQRVTFDPNPGVAGQPLAIRYNADGGPLADATTVLAHMGYNNWSTVLPDFAMSFNAGTQLWETTRTLPSDISQVDVVFNNGAGVWDNNNGQDWHVPVSGGQGAWTMDGQLEPTATLIAENGAFELHAELRGTRLYVAAPDAGEGADHFIFVAAPPGALRAAPWAKSGQVANWAAFVADENNNDFEGWFDASPAAGAAAATGPNGGWLEATIDLAAELGSMPQSVWLAFAPYGTLDGAALIAANQVPASVNGNGNVESGEYVEFDLSPSLPGDLNCDGMISVGDIGGFVLALTNPIAYAAQFPSCAANLADINNDGVVTVSDIGPFVVLLSGG